MLKSWLGKPQNNSKTMKKCYTQHGKYYYNLLLGDYL